MVAQAHPLDRMDAQDQPCGSFWGLRVWWPSRKKSVRGSKIKVGRHGLALKYPEMKHPISPQASKPSKSHPRSTPAALKYHANRPASPAGSLSLAIPNSGAPAQCPPPLATVRHDDTAPTLACACSCILMASDDRRRATRRQEFGFSSVASSLESEHYATSGLTTPRSARCRGCRSFRRPPLWGRTKFLATTGHDGTLAARKGGRA